MGISYNHYFIHGWKLSAEEVLKICGVGSFKDFDREDFEDIIEKYKSEYGVKLLCISDMGSSYEKVHYYISVYDKSGYRSQSIEVDTTPCDASKYKGLMDELGLSGSPKFYIDMMID